MRINYGINKIEKNKKFKRKRFLHENHHLEIDCTLEEYDNRGNNEIHLKIVKMINDNHPGWRITGYCPAEKDNVLGFWVDEAV